MLRDPRKHLGTNFVIVVKRESIIGIPGPFQFTVGAYLSLDSPTDTHERQQDSPRVSGGAKAHPSSAMEKSDWKAGGRGSPCSRQSAMTFKAKASVVLTASSRVRPYAITPGSA